MPYIKQEQRDQIADMVKRFSDLSHVGHILADAGELNYAITCIIKGYLDAYKLNYQTINNIIGALECAKAEFQRRVVTPFEIDKRKTNGDVY